MRLLALIIAGFFMLGATGAGPDMTTEDRCSAYALHGTDTASNLLDACDSTSSPAQSGANPFIADGGATCTNTAFPAHLDSARRSCNFDNVDDKFHIADGDIPDMLTATGWIKPGENADAWLAWHRQDAQGAAAQTEVRCGTNCMRFQGWALNAVATSNNDTVEVVEWSYFGISWTGLSANNNMGYISNPQPANTLEMGNTGFPNEAYGNPASDYVLGGTAAAAMYLGQMTEVAIFGEDLTAGEHCSVCRCGVGNMNPKTNGITGWLYDADGMCNQCVFDSPQTHCGPRRIM